MESNKKQYDYYVFSSFRNPPKCMFVLFVNLNISGFHYLQLRHEFLISYFYASHRSSEIENAYFLSRGSPFQSVSLKSNLY